VGKSKKSASITDEDWEDLDARFLSTICLFPVDEVLFYVVGEETTTGFWNKLEILYMKKSLTNKIFLKREFYNSQMKEGTKISDHLNVFNTLIFQLSSMEVKYKDEEKEDTLLCSFPESRDHLITYMWFRSTNSIDYETVVGALLSD
jgi:hypothetical protein